jgi:hypothetical protein
MKHFKALTIIALFLGLSETVSSQSAFGARIVARRSTATKSVTTRPSGCSIGTVITDPREMPLYVVNGHLIPPESRIIFNLINLDNFEDYKVFQKDDPVSKSYGDKGKNGVILMTLKPNIKLLTLEEVLEKKCISKSDQVLKVCFNKSIVEFPQTLIFDPTSPFRIEIISGGYWVNGEKINPDERFINIVPGN